MAGKAPQLTPFAKILIIAVVIGGGFFGYQFANKQGWIPKPAPKAASATPSKGLFGGSKSKALRVCLNTWVGFAPGVYYNGGLKPSSASRFTQDGVEVEFSINDDFQNILDGWKADQYDVVCNTADVLSTFFPNIVNLEPKVFMQIDWSRGGDVIVVAPGINNVQDLKGKRIAVSFGTPSQTLLLWVLSAGGLKYSDIEVIKAPTALDAASYFKAGKVDAAVVWSPDDQDCVKSVAGSKILRSTKDASNTIADIFYVKNSVLLARQDDLKKFAEGWFKAAAEINGSDASRAAAQKLMSTVFNQPEEVMNLLNARLCTYGDNVQFFNLNGDYNGIKGEDLYEKTATAIPQISLVFKESLPDQSTVPSWRSVSSTMILKSILNFTGPEQAAEAAATFTKPTAAIVKKEAFATKRVTINFETGAYALCDECRYKIDKEFADIAKSFAKCRIRVEGNTDNTGDYSMNKNLSMNRAKSVVDYLISRWGFDKNRFIVVGNGPDKPVASNDTEEGRAQNRNTAFELIGE